MFKYSPPVPAGLIHPTKAYALGHNMGIYTGPGASSSFIDGQPAVVQGRQTEGKPVAGSVMRITGLISCCQAWEAVDGYVLWWDGAYGWIYGPKRERAKALQIQERANALRPKLQEIATATGATLEEVEAVAAKLSDPTVINAAQFLDLTAGTRPRDPKPGQVAMNADVALLRARAAAGVEGY